MEIGGSVSFGTGSYRESVGVFFIWVVSQAMLAEIASAEPGTTRRFLFAAFYYLLSLIAIYGLIQQRGRMKWRRGAETSILSRIAIVSLGITWGTISLGAGLGWKFCIEHEFLLRIVPILLVVVFSCFDKFRHSKL